MAIENKGPPDASKLTRGGLITLLSGVFLSVMGAIIVNVALPSIKLEFAASPAAMSAVVAYYGLAYGVCLIIGSRLGDRYGRRRAFIVGLAVFTAASLLCGLAPSIAVLVGARIAQGLAAAVLFPQVLSIIRVNGGDEHERGRAFAAFGATLGLSAIAAQLIGGALVNADLWGTSWRPAFLIAVPIGVFACLAAARLIPESRSEGTRHLDLSGGLLCALGLGLVLCPLVEGRQSGWPNWTIWSMIAAVPVLACFVADQSRKSRRCAGPLLEPALFTTPAFSSGFAIAFLFHSTIVALPFTLALFLQIGLGYSPLDAALMLAPTAVAFLAASIIANRVLPKFGPFNIMLFGAVVVAVSYVACALIALAQQTPNGWGLVPALVAAGFGQGFFLPQLLNAVLAGATKEQAGSVSGLIATAQQIGGAFGVAIVGILYFGGLAARQEIGAQEHAHAFALALTHQIGAVVLVLCLLPILFSRKRRQPLYRDPKEATT